MRLAIAILLVVSATTPGLAASGETVSLMGGFFEPDSLTVAVGTNVTWTNEDGVGHTVTSSWDGGATFDARLRSGESFAFAFVTSGVFPIHCRPHAYVQEDGSYEGMVMTITVEALRGEGAIGEPLNETPQTAAFLILI